MKYPLFLFFFLFSLIPTILSTAEDDLVKSLPDYAYKGRLYSGYLDVDSVKKFHYMFNLAHEDPDSKPLVLWMNGGPGCSSLDGWANEHGPMQLDSEGKFVLNEYSWHRSANMIYLESPGDVGFSYINSRLDYEIAINDDISGKDNLQALLSFFTKFPSFKGRDFYIAGESYAGIYVPTLAYNVIKYNEGQPASQKINLKGILVGNGVADWNYDTTNAYNDFTFSHHLYSYELRLDFNKNCLVKYDETLCAEILEEMDLLVENVNYYDFLRECYIPTVANSEGGYSYDFSSRYFLYAKWAFPRLFRKLKEKKNLPPPSNMAVPCINDEFIEGYFNRQEVKEALHVDTGIKWEICSEDVNSRYEIQGKGSIWTYPTLIKNGIRILIYSGDTDMAVPFNGNQAWIYNLKLETVNPWHQWRAFDDEENVSGYVVKYQGLTFCTIKGTGHMAPQWKPKESYYMFDKFLKDEDF